MFFNSVDFAIFLPVVFILYWFVTSKNLKLQNLLLLGASYFFYAWWDWRFLSLLLFSSLLDYSIGLAIVSPKWVNRRKALFLTSIFLNLGILFFFKYFNFFIDSFSSVFTLFGFTLKGSALNIILPVGISFYTFKTLSYTIDVYQKRLEPTTNIVEYLAFVSFFPQILAGPIERAKQLLPQFKSARVFDYNQMVEGLRQILWGFFKKIVIADNCAIYTKTIFGEYETSNGSTLMLGVLFYSIQIYCDFSGYSDMAIGTARLFGFKSIRNFGFPYFSKSITDFWSRWHVSLSSWLRDYIFLPIAFNTSRKLPKEKYFFIKSEQWIYIFATLITFLICGLWHGASWTFVVWGFIFGVYLILGNLLKKQKMRFNKKFNFGKDSKVRTFYDIFFTFILVSFTWIFFQAKSFDQAIVIISKIFSPSIFSIPYFSGIWYSVIVVFLIYILLRIEWSGRELEFALANVHIRWDKSVRWITYYLLIICIIIFGVTNQTQFIYLQF